jgi:hypothetical protein
VQDIERSQHQADPNEYRRAMGRQYIAAKHCCAKDQRREAKARQEEAKCIEGRHSLLADVGHMERRQDHAQNTDRHIDPEDPAPMEISRDEATDRRAEQRTDQCGYGEHGQGAHDFALRHCSEDDEAADRHHHGAAHALEEAGGDEPFKRRRQSAGDRAQGEDGDGGAKHIAGAEAVGAPPAHRNENRERQQIGGESELEDDGILSEIGGHGGQRRRDHRRVGIFHEQGGGDDKRNDTRERCHLSGIRGQDQGSRHPDP